MVIGTRNTPSIPIANPRPTPSSSVFHPTHMPHWVLVFGVLRPFSPLPRQLAYCRLFVRSIDSYKGLLGVSNAELRQQMSTHTTRRHRRPNKRSQLQSGHRRQVHGTQVAASIGSVSKPDDPSSETTIGYHQPTEARPSNVDMDVSWPHLLHHLPCLGNAGQKQPLA